MNIEIQSAEIENNSTHEFTFTKPVKQFMAGFSKCFLKFSKEDHHIKEISIDLSNSEIKGNKVIIQPLLKMKDSSDHNESHKSSITIVVIAAVNDGNHDIHMYTAIKTNKLIDLPLINVRPTFIKSPLTYSFVQYSKSDHHVYSYFTEIAPIINSNSFLLKGQTVVQDQKYHFGNGKVSGGAIIYYGKDQNVLCADFDSKQILPDHTGNIGNTQKICFGDVPKDFNCDNYEFGSFINSYHVSFENSTDHHVSSIEISATFNESKLFLEDGKAYANICLKSFLSDRDKNKFDIPHNNIKGFVIALNKNLSE
ncbi:hypothetical protein M9Y10_034648 [Tritrichomonas musculus]|uniref:Uncharacterized protein n=1 Tax=Tritrichomonas musculus TaxID=1915356 RepID=A0ABR2KFP6_9EUKA